MVVRTFEGARNETIDFICDVVVCVSVAFIRFSFERMNTEI